ncbi:MFS transporter [Flagellimonas zhangzhouensis]|uniref:Fucose permease n=1 Tax=Flagellimonas zhangzhouensis TaxID=1073328 RepID=A0A1H2YVB3_9FLAO|nr:MFS transporter [Allomuricauda zhangzhouensis]SDR05704.1 Fucose permease [Allomuricauda zhangzhouensis]SDX09122.1 Fucose permease [Allomuricauda zhangzhouensis]
MKSLLLILSNPRYFAPSWIFTSVNIWFGTWAIYIPTVKEKLGIDKADLGIALFCLSLGVFTIFPMASKIINKIGVGRASWISVIAVSFAAMLPLMAPNYYMLMLGLYLFGAGTGFTDIAINTLVTEIEKEDKVNFMSAAHGFFSLGGILVGLGSFLIPIIGSPVLHMGITVVLVFLINLYFRKHYINVVAAPVEKEPFSFKLFKPLLLLGIIGFVSYGSEGAIIDWSALYLKEMTMAPEMLIGAGFLAFSTTMTLGRFLGDGISAKIGPIKIVGLGALIATVGYVLVLSQHTLVTIAGFALNGLGFSVIVPELFRIGGNVKGVDSSQGVAFIAGSGYIGFLMGPVILGFIAESASLNYSFILLLILALLIFGITFFLNRRGR